ncbi:hypothetical protein F4780DRAFT_796575 [Xylariomycetidae sp. FL0641]|nr:hypothetical protein F4780DRAFT_796575 [Xylariomycetidae sp. FL0641]
MATPLQQARLSSALVQNILSTISQANKKDVALIRDFFEKTTEETDQLALLEITLRTVVAYLEDNLDLSTIQRSVIGDLIDEVKAQRPTGTGLLTASATHQNVKTPESIEREPQHGVIDGHNGQVASHNVSSTGINGRARYVDTIQPATNDGTITNDKPKVASTPGGLNDASTNTGRLVRKEFLRGVGLDGTTRDNGTASGADSPEKKELYPFGYEYLRRQGWSAGTGLGKAAQGLLEPMSAEVEKMNIRSSAGIGHAARAKADTDWAQKTDKFKLYSNNLTTGKVQLTEFYPDNYTHQTAMTPTSGGTKDGTSKTYQAAQSDDEWPEINPLDWEVPKPPQGPRYYGKW